MTFYRPLHSTDTTVLTSWRVYHNDTAPCSYTSTMPLYYPLHSISYLPTSRCATTIAHLPRENLQLMPRAQFNVMFETILPTNIYNVSETILPKQTIQSTAGLSRLTHRHCNCKPNKYTKHFPERNPNSYINLTKSIKKIIIIIILLLFF